MNRRATPDIMRLRRCTVERPFALLKWVIFGHPRFLLRGLAGAQVENQLRYDGLQLENDAACDGRKQMREALGV